MKIIPYNPKLKAYAQAMRKNSILSEVLVWKCLKGKKISGYQFLRQKPLLEYIVDFYCPELNLAIEIDGSSHDLKDVSDEKRDKELAQQGVRFLRFSDEQVLKNPEGVIAVIEKWIWENR